MTLAGAILVQPTDAGDGTRKTLKMGRRTGTRLREVLTQEGDCALEGEIGRLGPVGIP